MTSSSPSRDSNLLDTEAIIVAYAMSRLNKAFLARFRYASWRSAFAQTGAALGVAPTSMKNLRDEFDPLHGVRKGWHQRPLRDNRQRVLGEFSEVGDDALLEIVGRLLDRDHEAVAEIIEPLAFAKERVENVAERLRTGRLAEEFFMKHSQSICGVPTGSLRDCRLDAAGFDFGIIDAPRIAIEVKGLKTRAGSVLFTDLEWRTARERASDYWLVVVGKLSDTPEARVWRNPQNSLRVRSSIRRVVAVSWQAAVSVG